MSVRAWGRKRARARHEEARVKTRERQRERVCVWVRKTTREGVLVCPLDAERLVQDAPCLVVLALVRGTGFTAEGLDCRVEGVGFRV
jgi:hypothetical protein